MLFMWHHTDAKMHVSNECKYQTADILSFDIARPISSTAAAM